MITFGVDCHKRTHTIAATNAIGQVVDAITISNDSAGYTEVYLWALSLGDERRWGIENSGSYGRLFGQYLLSQGEVVLEVSPHLTGKKRRGSFQSTKSDANDALAAARVVLQDGEKLHLIARDDETRQVALLVEHRDNLVGERTRFINQLHVHLSEMEPGYKKRLGQLRVSRAWRLCRRYPACKDDPIRALRSQLIRQLAGLILDLAGQIDALDEQLEPLVMKLGPSLLSIQGISIVSAAHLISYVGAITLVSSSAVLARYCGIAPILSGSADNHYHRVNPKGHRRLNSIFHQIAKTQSAHNVLARAYLAKKKAEGKTSKHAFRCLKRRMVDIVYSVWKSGEPYQSPVEQPVTEMAEAAM